MVAWLPTLKAVLPYVTQIVTTAIPEFTKKADKSEVQALTNNQIVELQVAATHNAESLKLLAKQLEQVVSSLDAGSIKIDKEIRNTKLLSYLAIGISIFTLIVLVISKSH